ncbi:MAG: DHH family phosphoesterase, partial [Thermofilaceae archaeon]
MTETVILAHGDTDGVTAAAIVKAALGEGEVYFTHPIGLLGDFKNYTRDAEIIVILDISLDERSLPALLSEFRNHRGVIIYIDHHPLSTSFQFEYSQLEVVHEESSCTAELAFRRFRLNWEMSRVALYG